MTSPLMAQLRADLAALAPSAATLFEPQAEALLAFAELLHRWNARIRLAGPLDLTTLVRHQLVDACGFALAVAALDTPRIIDVGAGGGLPGLALALLFPDRELLLVEPIHKKTAFLSHAVTQLGLKNTHVHTGRVDLLGRLEPPLRRAFQPDLALSRATLAPEPWLETGRRLVPPGGVVLIALAGEERLPESLANDPHTVEHQRWHYQVPATGAPRTLLARRVLTAT